MLDFKKHKTKKQDLFPIMYMLIRDFKSMNSSVCVFDTVEILCLAGLKQMVANLCSHLCRAGWEEISVIKKALYCL